MNTRTSKPKQGFPHTFSSGYISIQFYQNEEDTESKGHTPPAPGHHHGGAQGDSGAAQPLWRLRWGLVSSVQSVDPLLKTGTVHKAYWTRVFGQMEGDSLVCLNTSWRTGFILSCVTTSLLWMPVLDGILWGLFQIDCIMNNPLR